MQTVSLELSQKLYEKGLRIETEKWWTRSYLISKKENDPYFITQRPYHKPDEYPAPSTDELLTIVDREAILEAIHFSEVYVEHYRKFQDIAPALIFFEFIQDVNNLGKMCEWLLDNGWVYDEAAKCLIKTGRKND